MQTTQRSEMLSYLCDLIKNQNSETPKTTKIGLNNYKEVLKKSMQRFTDAKYDFVMK